MAHKKFTQEEFLEKVQAIYGDFYDYSETVLINTKKPLDVICPKHGKFTILAAVHLKGGGCKECYKESLLKPKEDKTLKFIEQSRAVHGDYFNYDQVKYVNNRTNVIIGCPIHGGFETKPSVHLQGFKCPICKFGGSEEERGEKFINKAKEIHKDRNYDYSKVVFVKRNVPVEIVCPTHGSFFQSPHGHLIGQKCPQCAKIEGAEKQRFSEDELLKVVREKYGDKHEYDFSNYTSFNSNIKIYCQKHGWFKQSLNNHIKGCSCTKCQKEEFRQKELGKFLELGKQIHNNKYDYSQVVYKNSKEKVRIICPKHGVFLQKPNTHLSAKSGCPSCAIHTSRFELWVKDVVEKSMKKEAHKFIMKNRKHIDVLCGDIGFEANGLAFHGEVDVFKKVKPKTYHFDKTHQALSQGITLYHILEDEYLDRPDILRLKIQKLCGDFSNMKDVTDYSITYMEQDIVSEFVKSFGWDTWVDGVCREFSGHINLAVQSNQSKEIIFVMSVKDDIITAFVENPHYNVKESLKHEVISTYVKDYKPKEITAYIPIAWNPTYNNHELFTFGFKASKKRVEGSLYYFERINKKFYAGELDGVLDGLGENFEGMSFEEKIKAANIVTIWDCGYWRLKYKSQ